MAVVSGPLELISRSLARDMLKRTGKRLFHARPLGAGWASRLLTAPRNLAATMSES